MCDYTCGKEPFDLQLVESADTEPTDMEGQSAIFFFFLAACTTCGILVPRPGIEPAPPALEAWSLKHWTAREVPRDLIQSCLCRHQW